MLRRWPWLPCGCLEPTTTIARAQTWPCSSSPTLQHTCLSACLNLTIASPLEPLAGPLAGTRTPGTVSASPGTSCSPRSYSLSSLASRAQTPAPDSRPSPISVASSQNAPEPAPAPHQPPHMQLSVQPIAPAAAGQPGPARDAVCGCPARGAGALSGLMGNKPKGRWPPSAWTTGRAVVGWCLS